MRCVRVFPTLPYLHSIAAKYWGTMLEGKTYCSNGFVQLCESIGDGCRFPASTIIVSLSGKLACRLKTPRIGEEGRTLSDDDRASRAKSAHHITY